MAKVVKYYTQSPGESFLFSKMRMSSPWFFPFFKNPSHYHKFHMWLKTLTLSLPAILYYIIQWTCTPLHAYLGWSFTCTSFLRAPAITTFFARHIESILSFSSIFVVMWCPAISSPTFSHSLHPARCSFLSLCLIVLFCQMKWPYSTHFLCILDYPIRAHGLCVSPPSFHPLICLDEFILFPFNQNKPWSHEITHWFKSGPGLSIKLQRTFKESSHTTCN